MAGIFDRRIFDAAVFDVDSAWGGKLYLVEIEVYDPALPGTKTLRYANNLGFTTKPTETPANAYYEPRLKVAANYEQNIYKNGTTSGRSEISFGEIVLNNADGALDDYINYGFDGRAVVIRRGREQGYYPEDFPEIFTGTMEQVEFDKTRVIIRIRDRQAEVADKPVQATKYAGNNSLPSGVEGVAGDLKGRPKPILKGVAENFAPPLVNTSKLIYQLSAKQINSIQNVYDMGVVLTAGTSRASIAALEAATVSAGTYDYYFGSDGSFIRLGSSPSGAVTVDATEGAASSNRTAAQIIKSLLVDFGGIDSGDIDADSITALDTANSAVVGFWQGTEETTIGDLIDTVCASIGAFWTVNELGEFTVGRLELPSGDPVATFESYQILSWERLATNDAGRGLPSFRVNLGYQKNYTVQSDADLSGSVAIARRNFVKEEFRQVTDSDSSVLTAHPLAPEFEARTLLTNSTDAQAEATRLLTMYKTRRDMLRVVLAASELPLIRLNDVVRIKLPRIGLTSGKDFRVIGRSENFEFDKTELTLWG